MQCDATRERGLDAPNLKYLDIDHNVLAWILLLFLLL